METLLKTAKNFLVNVTARQSYEEACFHLKYCVERLNPEELCILEKDPSLDKSYINFVNVAECQSFAISVFVIPTGLKLPLHDHVGMTVITKVLWGELDVDSFDFIEKDKFVCHHMGGEGVQYPSFTMRAGDCQLFYPFKANLHEFKARRRCAIVDFMWPPYNPAEDRDCHYFMSQPHLGLRRNDTETEKLVYLQRIPCPSYFYTQEVLYRGPPLDLRYL
ncbi:Plant cysteine oxidase 5 [Galdieria sulphuraria]|uniref:Cysteamine dioxygenase n=1 Tax=Galdieria sulphuraria TaxID=130081 RepID=M2Y3X5_GALSU|nr:cysteamine dioxygenase [Galdieria sulphuraria]EME30663.1 cysteamine dioxygenase [Galdieria sulphuraria]GJD09061.1 Plant cysteine oxidase 5 [Galdieria sulphuraria]|eukprot:XP_005707183.1 cysteamine dioxygenase [Galdieria sulphuraria]